MTPAVDVRTLNDFVSLTPGQKIILPDGSKEVFVGEGLENSCHPSCFSNVLLHCYITVKDVGDAILELRYIIPPSPTNIYAERMHNLKGWRANRIAEDDPRLGCYRKLVQEAV